MKLELQQYASLAEITSSIAVLLTLIFLVVELRDNTEVARSNSYSNSVAELNDFRLTVISDDNLFPVWQSFLSSSFENLSTEDGIRLDGIVIALFSIYEDAYYSYKYGIIGPQEWTRFERRICENWYRAVRMEGSNLLNGLTNEFYQYIENSCSRSETPRVSDT